jgi:hypothetical protein
VRRASDAGHLVELVQGLDGNVAELVPLLGRDLVAAELTRDGGHRPLDQRAVAVERDVLRAELQRGIFMKMLDFLASGD